MKKPKDMTPARWKALKAAANRLTELVIKALDKFPPKERAKRLKAYLEEGYRGYQKAGQTAASKAGKGSDAKSKGGTVAHTAKATRQKSAR